MENVEFKAELRDPALARSICAAIGATQVATLRQTDTYYRLPAGRLKERKTASEPTEWVFYERPDDARPRVSRFTIYSEAEAVERFAPERLERWLTVRKTRELFMLGNVRIHLDRVEGLGSFIEFEALVSRKQDIPGCHRAIARLRRALAPALGEAIAVGYSDLLAAQDEP